MLERIARSAVAAPRRVILAAALLAEWLSGKGSEKARRELGAGADEVQLSKYFFKEVFKNTYFNQHSELGSAATRMLEDWEAGDPAVVLTAPAHEATRRLLDLKDPSA